MSNNAFFFKTSEKIFWRLTNLVPELLDMVDEKKISFNPAVELSYLDTNQQRDFLEAMQDTQNAPSPVSYTHLTIRGFSVHPGTAKDTMINASNVAMEFHQALPKMCIRDSLLTAAPIRNNLIL